MCVVDSGIERDVISERCRQRSGEPYPIEGGIFTADHADPALRWASEQPAWNDCRGHPADPGTRARLYSADVFGPRGSCEVEVVQRALHWAIHVWKCKIVNLSLGVPEERLAQVQRRESDFCE